MGKTIIKSKQFMKNKTKLLQLLASVTTDENNRIKLELLTLMTSNQYVTRTKLKPYNNKKKTLDSRLRDSKKIFLPHFW